MTVDDILCSLNVMRGHYAAMLNSISPVDKEEMLHEFYSGMQLAYVLMVDSLGNLISHILQEQSEDV